MRLPTVFTILAQVSAAFLVSAGNATTALDAWPRWLLILLSATAAYWSGMILNDLWDLAEDRIERPSRPLPSGMIAVATARTVGWGLLPLSILLAGLSGWVPVAGLTPSLAPPLIAAVLAVGIVLYNGPLKPTPLAPLAMGGCRLLVFLLGASPWVSFGAAEFMQPQGWFPPHLLAIAVGFGVYITGITTISRLETKSGQTWDLNVGLLVALIGAGILAFAPRVAPPGTVWQFVPDLGFSVLIGLVTLPVLIRGLRASSDPRPELIQNLVRIGVLNLIPYSAALVLLVAGSGWALATFCLAILAIVSSAKLRVT